MRQKQDRCGNWSSERWHDLSEITHLLSAGVTFARNIPFVLLRQGSKTLSTGPNWRRSFGSEEVKGRPWLLWWCWWLPAQKTHPASKSLFWAVRLLLGTKGALELSSRASQRQLTSPHCNVRYRTEKKASHPSEAWVKPSSFGGSYFHHLQL